MSDGVIAYVEAVLAAAGTASRSGGDGRGAEGPLVSLRLLLQQDRLLLPHEALMW
jgi:hypothetical protein